MKKPLPNLTTDKAAEDFIDNADQGYSLKAGLRSRWLSGVEAGGGIRFDSAQRTTPKLSQLKREAPIRQNTTYQL